MMVPALRPTWRYKVSLETAFVVPLRSPIHNGGGVGWGELINGGFGMILDGIKETSRRLEAMLLWDVNNGISRRSWVRNDGVIFAIKRAMEAQPLLKVTLPNIVADNLLDF